MRKVCLAALAGILFAYSSLIFASSAYSFIYQGDVVSSDEQFPFVVGIYEKDPDYPQEKLDATCTGSIIGDAWVLTAAHCVMDTSNEDGGVTKPENISIGTGHLAKHAKTANKIIPVEKIFVWDSKKFSPDHDIALLKLTKPTGIIPVKLPENPDDTGTIKTEFQKATAVGYGWVDTDYYDDGDIKPIFDNKLHYGPQVIQPDKKVEELITNYVKKYPDPDPIPVYNPLVMMGVTSPTGQHITSDDSGGPLLIASDNNPVSMVVIGVTSWGTSPNKETIKSGEWLKEQPTIYASLLYSEHLAFIKNIMKNN